MEKRSIVHAVYAESLVFESNFGRVAVPEINPGDEVIERAQSVPISSAAAVTSENAGMNDTTASPILH
jgi:hypothetical protein